jgi:hypothetical protein
MKSIRAIAVVVMLVAMIGCASTSPGRPKNEPGIIALLNSTGTTLKAVRIREDRDGPGGVRLGEMSPVLPDFTYPFERATNAKALPQLLRVQWRDAADRDHSDVVEIGEILKQATGAPGEALLFEIRPSGTVSVRIESVNATR